MQIQSNFSLGEISPLLYARVDYEGYYKGLKRARNVLILPQGSLVRRFGTRYIGEVTGAGDYQNVKFITLQYLDTDIYLCVFKPLSVDIYHNDVIVSTLATNYTTDEVKDLYFTQDANSLWIFHQNHKITKLEKSGSTWALNEQTIVNPPVYQFDTSYKTMTFTPSATTGNITITSSAAIFTADFVGGIFFGNSGTVRLTGFTSSTVMAGRTLTDFANLNPIAGSDAFLAEPLLSATRGWPKTGTFYQNRLVIGGTKELPEIIALSAIGEYLDFDEGKGEDDEAIAEIIKSDRANIIKHVLHSTNLILFTSSGEWSTPPFTDKPTTPTNTYFIQQAEHGIAASPPVVVNDVIIYVDKGGKIVRALSYNVQAGKYTGQNISVTAPHLINNPISACEFENPSVYDGSYYLLVNGDGTLAILQLIAEQNINAWTLSTTDGYFRAVTSSDSEVYFIVERVINGQRKFYIEKVNFDDLTDCTIEFTSGVLTTSVTGLSALEGKEVYAIADGTVVGQHKVTSGKITLDTPAYHVKVGLSYTPEIVPLPVNAQTPEGSNLYKNKAVKNVYVEYQNSLGIYVNDFPLPMQQYSNGLASPPVPESDYQVFSPMQGWDPRAEISITQKEPYPLTILAIGREVL